VVKPPKTDPEKDKHQERRTEKDAKRERRAVGVLDQDPEVERRQNKNTRE
jgi:hypothetical protein